MTRRTFLTSVGLPPPALVWASTKAIFHNEYANRRQLPYGGRQVNVYTMELRIADGSVTREYMVQLAT